MLCICCFVFWEGCGNAGEAFLHSCLRKSEIFAFSSATLERGNLRRESLEWGKVSGNRGHFYLFFEVFYLKTRREVISVLAAAKAAWSLGPSRDLAPAGDQWELH